MFKMATYSRLAIKCSQVWDKRTCFERDPWGIHGWAFWRRQDDGRPSMKPQQEPQGSPRSSIPSSKVKEKVQALIDQLAILPRSTSIHKPYFVYLWREIQMGNFLHAPPSFSLGSHLSNKPSCNSFGVHLVGQTAPKSKLSVARLNPAHRILRV